MKGLPKTAFAVGAHPDDVEFMMAGTLMLLSGAGYEIHYMNVANGSCGTVRLPRAEIVRVRTREARSAARLIGAHFHPPLVNDIEIFYENALLARLGAVMRKVNPEILLVPAPDDYMEDHTIAARLAVTAAFCRGMRNFHTSPRVKPVAGQVAVYHALPMGLHDSLRRRVSAGQYVDVASVLEQKKSILAIHKSQKEWLDKSQGLDAYVNTLVEMAAEAGRMSGRFSYAEGWRRHNHLGFSAEGFDPLTVALGSKVFVDPAYERGLT